MLFNYLAAMHIPLLLSIAAFITSFLSFIFLLSYLKKRATAKIIKDEILSEIRSEVDLILGAIDEATERDITLIKEREKELESLLEEVDRRLNLYIRELESRKRADDVYEQAHSQNSKTYQEIGKNKYRAAVQEEESKSGEEAQAFPLPVFSVKSDAWQAQAEKPSSPTEQIRDLLKAGFSPSLIASRLGLSIAEVEFAAALYERRDSTAESPPITET